MEIARESVPGRPEPTSPARSKDFVAEATYRSRLENLHRIIANLNRADTLAEVYQIATQGAAEMLQADRSSVLIFGPDERVHFVAWYNLSEAYRQKVDGHSPWRPHQIDAHPIFIADIAHSDLADSLKESIMAEGIYALGFIPLVAPQRLLGKFMVYYDRPYQCTDEGRRLAQILADNLAAIILRMQALEETRRAEEKYRGIFENAAEGIYQSASDGKLLAANPALAHMLGYDNPEQLLGIEDAAVFHPDPAVRAQLRELIHRRGVLRNVEVELLRRDGSSIWALLNTRMVHDEQGHLLYYEGILTDITERKQVAVQLKRQLDFAQALNRIAATIIAQEDADYILKAFTAIIGETLRVDRTLIYDVRFDKQAAVGLCEWLNPAHPEITSTKDIYPLSMFASAAAYMRETGHWLESHLSAPNDYLQQDGVVPFLHAQIGIQSLLWYPFAFHADGYYLLVFNQVTRSRPWAEAELDFIDAVTRQISLALQKLALLAERKQAEKELRRSEERYRTLHDYNPAMYFTLDVNGRVLAVNQFGAEHLGYKTKELVGQSVLTVFHPAEHEKVNEQLQNCVKNPFQVFQWEIQKVHKNGRAIWVNEIARAITDANGETIILVVCNDITERRRAETALRQSEEKMRSLARLARQLEKVHTYAEIVTPLQAEIQTVLGYRSARIYLLEEDGRYARLLAGREEMAGGAQKQEQKFQIKGDALLEEVCATTRPVVIPDARTDPRFEKIEAYADNRTIVNVPVMLERKYLGVLSTGTFGKEGVRLPTPAELDYLEAVARHVAVVLDRVQFLLEQERAARALQESNQRLQTALAELRETQERLVRRERLAAVGQLAAGLAHDFNNIMAVIVLYTQMNLRAPDLPSKMQKRLQTILDQAWRATELVEQILDFSRRTVLEPRPVDLAPLLARQVELLKRTLPENIRIQAVCGQGNYIINVDPTRMQQVIMNLAINARDAMPAGGSLRLELDQARVTQVVCAVCRQPVTGEWVRLRVTDSGSGIPPEALPHIFEPFFTTKRTGQGSGLGLPQIAGIVAQHGGHITVQTEVGVGAMFTVYLPPLPAQPQPEMAPEADVLLPGQGETILLVEDNADVQNALADNLVSLNYQVITAGNGREALAILAARPAEIDLVLSDMVMPEMGGGELFAAIRQQGLSVPVVILSGYAAGNELQKLQEQGLAGWLPKPVDMVKLSRLLAQLRFSNR